MNKLLRKTLKSSVLITLCVVITYPFVILLDPITTTFNITANTERITVKTLDEKGSQLSLIEADIYDAKLKPIFKKFTGSLRLNKDVFVTIDRVSYGPAILKFDAAKDQVVGTLFDENTSFVRQTDRHLRITINNLKTRADNGQTFIIPMDGMVNLGRPVDFEVPGESTAVLRSGQIYMTGRSRFSESFDAGSKQLYLGDQIIFNDQQNKAFGFVTLNEEPGMQAAYRVMDKYAIILKPGVAGSGLIIKATNLDRLLHASFFQQSSLFFGALVVFTTIFSFLKDTPANKKFILSLLK